MITALRTTDIKSTPSFGNLSNKVAVPPTFVKESKLFGEKTQAIISNKKSLYVLIAGLATVAAAVLGANKFLGNK